MMAIGAFPNWWRQMPKKRPRGGGGPTTPPTPPAAVGIVGYARVYMEANGLSGGSISLDDIHTPHPSAVVMPCTTYTQLRTALLSPVTQRFIKVMGSDVLSGAGDTMPSITNPHFTVSGLLYTGGGVKDYEMVQRCGDAIWSELKLAPGEGSTASKSSDRAALKVNPGSNATDILRGVAFDHVTGSWGPDVILGLLNNVWDITSQYCLWGPSLLESNISSSPNGYGVNVTSLPAKSDPGTTIFARRLTFYRNLRAMCAERNLKWEYALGVDSVNEGVYDWGDPTNPHGAAPVQGNAQAANIVGAMLKRGPESGTSTRGFEPDSTYDQFDDSYWLDGNIGITAVGGSFTPDWSQIDAAALRSSAYDGGPTASSHGSLSVATANGTLFGQVVAAAGRTYQDSVDTAVKAHAVAGTSDGYYNGAGFSAPHPSWP